MSLSFYLAARPTNSSLRQCINRQMHQDVHPTTQKQTSSQSNSKEPLNEHELWQRICLLALCLFMNIEQSLPEPFPECSEPTRQGSQLLQHVGDASRGDTLGMQFVAALD